MNITRPGSLWCAVLLAIVILLPTTAGAQDNYTDTPEMPGGVEGQRIQALIDFINAADPALVEPFFAEHCTPEFFEMAPLEMHQEVLVDFHEETGGAVLQDSVGSYRLDRVDEGG